MPAHYDLLIPNGACVLPRGLEATDVGVRGGHIVMREDEVLGEPIGRPAKFLG